MTDDNVLDIREFNRKAMGLPPGWLPKVVIARAYLVQVFHGDRGVYNIAGCDVPPDELVGQIIQVKRVASKGQEVKDPFNKIGTWATLVLAEHLEDNLKEWWAVTPIKINWSYK